MPLSSDQAKEMSKICLPEAGEEVSLAKTKLSGASKALAIDTKDSNGPVGIVLPSFTGVR